MASLNLKNICKIYPGDIEAVSNFNLEIHDKEFIVFVGPSGCGKSTTLRMIAGLEDITAGELYIGERQVNDVPPGDRDIAMVFQNYALYPHMTVFDNMAFGLQIRKRPKKEIQKRVTEAARILDIEHLLKRKPKALSGGERQRVALGRAITRDPQVFLLDEPLSNLDAKLRAQMRTEIIKLHRSLGTTFVYVTHDQVEAMTMGNRICVMKDGVIQQVDTPRNIYSRPSNLFVAGFIGMPQMNFIEVTIRWSGKTYYAVFGINEIEIPCERAYNDVLSNYVDKSVIMGVRPEHISISRGSGNIEGAGFQAEIEVVEMLGAETYLYLKLGYLPIVARGSEDWSGVCVGNTIGISINSSKIHFFDRETEASVLWDGGTCDKEDKQ